MQAVAVGGDGPGRPNRLLTQRLLSAESCQGPLAACVPLALLIPLALGLEGMQRWVYSVPMPGCL